MNSASSHEAEGYVASLSQHLAPITLAEREDIIREIRAHIRDSVEFGVAEPAVLARLGPPEDLAAQYRDGLLVRAASRSLSPLLLLRTTLRVASRGVLGVTVFFVGIIGYFTGATLIVTAFLRPFYPAHIGVFVKERHVGAGSLDQATASGMHEVFGWWYIPFALIVGCLLLVVTTYAVRGYLRVWSRNRSHSSKPSATPVMTKLAAL